ncbi:MAG: hypothetical protein Q8R83_01750 [Legionellaceae bacterium]|nr:hypothetical protein [Legionellaceae bacterium]
MPYEVTDINEKIKVAKIDEAIMLVDESLQGATTFTLEQQKQYFQWVMSPCLPKDSKATDEYLENLMKFVFRLDVFSCPDTIFSSRVLELLSLFLRHNYKHQNDLYRILYFLIKISPSKLNCLQYLYKNSLCTVRFLNSSLRGA